MTHISRRVLLFVFMLAAVSVSALSISPEQAEAFPNWHQPSLCDDNSQGHIFVGSNWGPYKFWWLDGATGWNDVVDEDGDELYVHGEGNEIPTRRMDLGVNDNGTTISGNFTCDFGSSFLFLDTGVGAGNPTQLVAAHETGHAQGMQHTDHFAIGGAGWMTTCSASRSVNLRKDDFAYALEETGITLTANSSFEADRDHWRKFGGGWWTVTNGTSAEGQSHLAASNAITQVYNATRYIEPNTGNSDGYIRAGINYRDFSSGTVTFKLQARRLDFPTETGCAVDQYVGNLDLRQVPSYPNGTAFVDVGSTITVNPTNGWKFNDVALYTGAAFWEGVDIRVVVLPNTNGTLYLDHTRNYQV